MTKNLKLNFLLSMLGMFILSFGINIMIEINSGLAPFDLMAMLFADLANVDFAIGGFLFQLTVGIIVLILKLLNVFKLSFIEVITSVLVVILISLFIFITGFIINFNVELYSIMWFILFTISFLMYALGIFIIVKNNIISTAYDKFTYLLANKLNANIGLVRLVQDVILLLIAIFLNLVIGFNLPITLFTFVIWLLTGSVISIYNFIYERLFLK